MLRVTLTSGFCRRGMNWSCSPLIVLSFPSQPNFFQMEAVLCPMRLWWDEVWPPLQITLVTYSWSSCFCAKFRFLAQFNPLLSKLVPSDTFYRAILTFPTDCFTLLNKPRTSNLTSVTWSVWILCRLLIYSIQETLRKTYLISLLPVLQL